MKRQQADPTTVVGAGPAGLAATITLARAERPVQLFERHESVGQRFHGDMQGLENWSGDEDVLDRLRSLGIATDFAWRGFDEVTFYDSRLRPAIARTKRPLFYLVRRGPEADTLDSALLRQARDAGAEIRLGAPALVAGPGTIVATGPRKADGIAVGYLFRTDLPDQAHAIVHPTIAPGAYAYLLIWDGRATLATCVFRDLKGWKPALDAAADTFMRLVPGLRLDDARRFGGYGALLGRTRYSDESGRLYAGEAAGLQDAEWGFGMVTAMRSGVLAADSLINGREYAERARHDFDAARAAGLVNRAVWERSPRRLMDGALRFEAGRGDLPGRLQRHWAPSPMKSILARTLLAGFHDRLHDVDRTCHETSCRCLRCACADVPRPEGGLRTVEGRHAALRAGWPAMIGRPRRPGAPGGTTDATTAGANASAIRP